MASSPKKIILKKKHPFNLDFLKVNPIQFAEKESDDTLGKTLEYLSDYYYNKDAIVTDQIFDTLQEILRNRNPSHASLTKIGAPILPEDKSDIGDITKNILGVNTPTITNTKHRQKHSLPFWMGSMDKIKPADGNKLTNWFQKYPGSKVMSDKLDGISGLLVYTTTTLPTTKSIGQTTVESKLYTRGDGLEGQDISCILPYLKLPTVQQLDLYGNGIQLAIRGEMIMSKKTFEPFSKSVPNARNLVSGIVNSKTVKTKLVELVDFIAYEIIEPSGLIPSEQFSLLKQYGFTPAFSIVLPTQIVTEDWLIKHFVQRKKVTEYEIDGTIVSEDQAHPRNLSGNPKYAFAFKMMINEDEQVAQTEVLAVNWNAQRYGNLFPVLSIRPVSLPGIIASNASGKSAKFIVENGIGPGAIIKVARDGDVIPGVFSIVKPVAPSLPDMAKTPYHWNSTKVNIILDNPEDTPEVHFKYLLHFFRTMNVSGFSEGLIKRCIDSSTPTCDLSTINNILKATPADFLTLPGIKITMANKIYQAIQIAMEAPDIGELMVASSIFGRGYGKRKIKLLLQNIPDVLDYPKKANWKTLLLSKICSISGFEKKTAEPFVDGLVSFQYFFDTLPTDIQKRIVNPYLPSKPKTVDGKIAIKKKDVNYVATGPTSTRFVGKTIVFTGFRNKDWEKIIEQEGGKIGSTISKNITTLVIKDHSFTSNKVIKAKELGITVLSEAEFILFQKSMVKN